MHFPFSRRLPRRNPFRHKLFLEKLEERNLLTFFGGYRTVTELYADLATTAANYPDITHLVDYGQSYAASVGGVTTPGGDFLPGYDLMAMEVTNKAVPGPKPVFFLNSGIHAREISGPEVAMRYLDYLTQNYGSDPDVTWLVDYHDIWIEPEANPDGHALVELGTLPPYNGNPFQQRKNADMAGCSTWPPSVGNQSGVDINRNFADHWGLPGSSNDPCDQTYRGTSPASEPETAALQNLVAGLIPAQRGPGDDDPAPDDTTGIYIDVHTFGGLVLWPWGHTTNAPPNEAGLSAIGRKFASYNHYLPGQVSRTLYMTSGSSESFVYGQTGAPGFTFELNSNGFLDSYSSIDGHLWPENRDAFLCAAKIARTPYMTIRGPDALQVTAGSDGANLFVSATVNSTQNGGRNIAAAEFYIDTPPWADGAKAISMEALDGNFDSSIEDVDGVQSTDGLGMGRHIVFVRGQDLAGNWGPVSAAFFDLGNGPGGSGWHGPTSWVGFTPGLLDGSSRTATGTLGQMNGMLEKGLARGEIISASQLKTIEETVLLPDTVPGQGLFDPLHNHHPLAIKDSLPIALCGFNAFEFSELTGPPAI